MVLWFCGANANFLGDTLITGGVVQVDNNLGLGKAGTGKVVINSNTSSLGDVTIAAKAASTEISDGGTIHLRDDMEATLKANLLIKGGVGAKTINFDTDEIAAATILTMDGAISEENGIASINKKGAGKVILAAANSIPVTP